VIASFRFLHLQTSPPLPPPPWPSPLFVNKSGVPLKFKGVRSGLDHRDIKPGNIMKSCQETAASLQRSMSNLSDFESTASSSFSNGSFSRLFGRKPAVNPTLTGTIEFASFQKSRRLSIAANSLTASVDYLASSYKMIDFGTAVAIHEAEDIIPSENMKTVTEMAFAGCETCILIFPYIGHNQLDLFCEM
jgi:serine/threonine protein kinase